MDVILLAMFSVEHKHTHVGAYIMTGNCSEHYIFMGTLFANVFLTKTVS